MKKVKKIFLLIGLLISQICYGEIDKEYDRHQTAELFKALIANNKELVQQCLEKSADPRSQNQESMLTPLQYACIFPDNPNIHIMRLLLNNGADPNIKDKHGTTALSEICWKERPNSDIITLFLEQKANPNSQDNKQSTILHDLSGASNPNLKIIKLLLDYGAQPTIKDNNGNTALHSACKNKGSINIELITILIDKGADPLIKNNEGLTAFDFAYQNTQLNVPVLALFADKMAEKEAFAQKIVPKLQTITPKTSKQLITRDIPLSQSRQKPTILRDFDDILSLPFHERSVLIYNNDDYEKLQTTVQKRVNDKKILKIAIEQNMLKPDINLFKGETLSTPRGEDESDPIGYFLYLPADIAHTKAIIIMAYGGATNKNDSVPLNSFFDFNLPIPVANYLLSKNIGIMVLNTIDYKENPNFQAKISELMQTRVFANIKSAFEALYDKNERLKLSQKLSLLPDKFPLYFYGTSFGGGLGIRYAEKNPGTLDGYISHDGSVTSKLHNSYISPINYVQDLQDNVLLLQNYTDNNVLLERQMDFYNALKKVGKAGLVMLHFFPEANVRNFEQTSIGHFYSEEPWYLQEYTQTILDFIEKTKHGRTRFRLAFPGSIQELREFFHTTAFHEHVEESSPIDRFVSVGFKLYKNSLQWRDKELRKINTFEMNPFMENYFNLCKNKNNIHSYDAFLQKALDILSTDSQKADESWNTIYLPIAQGATNADNLRLIEDIISGLSEEMQKQVEIIYADYRKVLVEALKKSRALGHHVIIKKVKEAASLERKPIGTEAK